jgi:hypothetical protein
LSDSSEDELAVYSACDDQTLARSEMRGIGQLCSYIVIPGVTSVESQFEHDVPAATQQILFTATLAGTSIEALVKPGIPDVAETSSVSTSPVYPLAGYEEPDVALAESFTNTSSEMHGKMQVPHGKEAAIQPDKFKSCSNPHGQVTCELPAANDTMEDVQVTSEILSVTLLDSFPSTFYDMHKRSEVATQRNSSNTSSNTSVNVQVSYEMPPVADSPSDMQVTPVIKTTALLDSLSDHLSIGMSDVHVVMNNEEETPAATDTDVTDVGIQVIH